MPPGLAASLTWCNKLRRRWRSAASAARIDIPSKRGDHASTPLAIVRVHHDRQDVKDGEWIDVAIRGNQIENRHAPSADRPVRSRPCRVAILDPYRLQPTQRRA